MATELIIAVAALAALGGGLLQYRLALARQRRALGELKAGAEGFVYRRAGEPERHVRWDSIAEICFEREQVTDYWSEHEDTWLEQRWVIGFGDGVPALTITHGSAAAEHLALAAARYLPGFRADAGLLGQPEQTGRQIVYAANRQT
ncbi:MAG: hypothetical protein OHK0022_43560 [Roseiflexaceae bacterium]